MINSDHASRRFDGDSEVAGAAALVRRSGREARSLQEEIVDTSSVVAGPAQPPLLEHTIGQALALAAERWPHA